jgi:hypothetical protein
MKIQILWAILVMVAFSECKKEQVHCLSFRNVNNDLKGFNRADKRDNYVNRYIVPSGLDSTATYADMLKDQTR